MADAIEPGNIIPPGQEIELYAPGLPDMPEDWPRVEQIKFLESAGERCQVEAARLITVELDSGTSAKQLAAEIGRSRAHVMYMARAWELWQQGGCHHGDTSFSEVYHSPEVRSPNRKPPAKLEAGDTAENALPVTADEAATKPPAAPEATETQPPSAEAAPAATPGLDTHSDEARKISAIQQESDQALIARQSARITELTDQVMSLGTRYEAQITDLKTRNAALARQNAALEAQLRTALRSTQPCGHDDRQWQRMTAVMTALESRGVDVDLLLRSGGGREEQPWA
jgi:hypothetical protein